MSRQSFISFFALLSCALFTASAQGQTKVAHVNTGIVLEALPESALADSLLAQYQDSLAMGFQLLEQEFVSRLQVVQNADSMANKTVKQQQALQQELQQLQQEAGVYQEEAARMFEQRRVVYLQPLVDRVRLAIEAYAKTNDINLVLDTAVGGTLVYADDTKEITEAIIELISKTQ